MSTYWATDLHTEDASADEVARFKSLLQKLEVKRLILTGDIAPSRVLPRFLRELCESVAGLSILYVLGNHDYYGSGKSLSETTSDMQICQPPGALFLPRGGVQADELDIHFVGVSGWASGEGGEVSSVETDDFQMIHEFAGMPSKRACLDRMHSLAQQSAMMVGIELRNALRTRHKTVVLATHVPPYPEAMWHEGAHSDPDMLPFFCNRSAGRIIDRALPHFAAANKRLIVLCGHTHHAGVYHRSPQCTVYTAGHAKGRVALAAEITSRGVERHPAYGGICTFVPELHATEACSR